MELFKVVHHYFTNCLQYTVCILIYVYINKTVFFQYIFSDFSIGIFNGFIIPLMFCLLPNKRQSTYEQIWKVILEQNINIKPETVMMDFERATINSFQKFSQTQQWGVASSIWINQSVYRQVQKKGLKKLYENDEGIATKIKMLCALAYIPQEFVIDALLDETHIPIEIQPIFDYFEDTYIGRTIGKSRRRALFDIGMTEYSIHMYPIFYIY